METATTGAIDALSFIETVIANRAAALRQAADENAAAKQYERSKKQKQLLRAIEQMLGETLYAEWKQCLTWNDSGDFAVLELPPEFGMAKMRFVERGGEWYTYVYGVNDREHFRAVPERLGAMLECGRKFFLALAESVLEGTGVYLADADAAAQAHANLKLFNAPEADALYAAWRTRHDTAQKLKAEFDARRRALAEYRAAYEEWLRAAVPAYERNRARLADWSARHAGDTIMLARLYYAAIRDDGDEGASFELLSDFVTGALPDQNGFWIALRDGAWRACRYRNWARLEPFECCESNHPLPKWWIDLAGQGECHARRIGDLYLQVMPRPGVTEAEWGDRIRAELNLEIIPEPPSAPAAESQWDIEKAQASAKLAVLEPMAQDAGDAVISETEDELPF